MFFLTVIVDLYYTIGTINTLMQLIITVCSYLYKIRSLSLYDNSSKFARGEASTVFIWNNHY